jgi:hypothetical protein
MRYLKRYNEELHLNPLQFGKKKWIMPGGLTLYTNSKYISSDEFEKFITNPETLKHYFPNTWDKMKKINKYQIPFKLDDENDKVIWFEVDSNELDIYGNMSPNIGDDIEMVTKNYLIIELTSRNEINLCWFQTFQCNLLNILPYDHKLKPKEKANIKYRLYQYPIQDISIGDNVFKQNDLDWNEIIQDVRGEQEKKNNSKKKIDENHERRIKLRKPFFKDLQDTLFDLTLALSDLLNGAVNIEKDDIINTNDILSFHTEEGAFDGDNIDFLYEISKELKQLKVNIENMDFYDGKLRDYVRISFSLESGRYGHDGDLSIYFYWLDKWK